MRSAGMEALGFAHERQGVWSFSDLCTIKTTPYSKLQPLGASYCVAEHACTHMKQTVTALLKVSTMYARVVGFLHALFIGK